MAVKHIGWQGADTGFRPSESIWGNCPWDQIKMGQVAGIAYEDKFDTYQGGAIPTTAGAFTAGQGLELFSSTGGTLTSPPLSAATASGIASDGIVIGSDGDNEGVGIRTVDVPFGINRLNFDFWAEARVKKSTIGNTQFEMFFGLLENIALTAVIPMTATAATLSDNNMVGWYSTETTGAKASSTYKANGVTAVVVGADEATFVADTYTKLGFRYSQRDKDGAFVVSFYQDGTRCASFKQLPSTGNGTDFPNDVAMGLVFAVRNATGSTPGTATLQWWRAAQLYAPLS